MNTSSLKTKMSLAVSLLMTAVLSLLALVAFWYFERQYTETIARQQYTLVSSMAEELDSKILNAQKQLVAVASSVTPQLVDNRRLAQRFLDAKLGLRTVFNSGTFIFSPAGRLIATSPAEPQLLGRDYRFREYIRQTITTGRPQISTPFSSSQAHRHPIVMFTAPFYDNKGNPAGILAGAVDLLRENFLGKLASIKIGEKGYLYLYSTDRTMIVHPDRGRILQRDVPVGVNRLFDRAIKGFEGTGETVNSRGLHVFSSFKHLSSTRWILAANYPWEEVYAPIYRARWFMLAALVLALLLSNAIVWWSMRRLTAPLLLFTRHVEGIAGTSADPTPFLVRPSDEIGTLAQAFNDMVSAMNRQKRTIREQKDFSDTLLLNSAIPTFVLDVHHRVVSWNRSCEDLTGIKAAEIVGSADAWKAFYQEKCPVLADFIFDIDHNAGPSQYVSCGTSSFATDGLQAEGWCQMPNGIQRYLFADAVPVRNAEGAIIAVIQTVQDFTARKRAEQELEFKNVILSTQQETTIDGILVVDGNGAVISFNRRLIDLWDFPAELMAAREDAPLLQLATTMVVDPDSFLARVKYLYDHREEKSRELIFLLDGRVFDRYSAPMLGEDGKYYGRVWYYRDISERKQMETALRESEERYRKLVELSPEAIYIHTGGILVFANAAGARLLGAERPEDIYGRKALDFVHPDYRELVVRRLSDLKLDGEPNPVIEEMFLRFDGSAVAVEVSSLVFTFQGKDAVLVVARDIRERKKMQDELLKAQKLESLGVLAGGIAHDFNNILTGILGNLSLANARIDPNHVIAKHLVDCEKAAVRAGKLTQQLLTFACGGEPVKKLIDPAHLIGDTVQFVLRGSNVRSVVDLPDNLWNIQADSGQLSQALHNILINAVQAMPDGGEVVIRAANRTLAPEDLHQLPIGHYITIAIEDRGCGIPPENLGSIFDPYFTTKPDGSGLGLASVYSIVKRHGGAVEVSSTADSGSSFTIYLPALPGVLVEDEVSVQLPERVGCGRVLIMDDEELIRDIASEILGFAGYSVESCATGKETVERFLSAREQGVPFAAVILDLTVPGGMGGKETARMLLEIDPAAVLIVSSGYSTDQVVANYREYGFSGVVAKPFAADTLTGELGRLLAKQR
jgi:PAS domain S-box-containing protein